MQQSARGDEVVMANASLAAVYQLTVHVLVDAELHEVAVAAVLPPQSREDYAIDTMPLSLLEEDENWRGSALVVSFTDSAGQRWTRGSLGILKEEASRSR